jgi:hypothetical protein
MIYKWLRTKGLLPLGICMCHSSSRLTSKVSTSKALTTGGPRSIDTVVPTLESKSLPRRGPGASGTYRNQYPTWSTDHAFSEFTELVLLGVSGGPYNGD